MNLLVRETGAQYPAARELPIQCDFGAMALAVQKIACKERRDQVERTGAAFKERSTGLITGQIFVSVVVRRHIEGKIGPEFRTEAHFRSQNRFVQFRRAEERYQNRQTSGAGQRCGIKTYCFIASWRLQSSRNRCP